MLTGISLVRTYEQIMKDGDPRVENWFGMSSPFPCLATTILYFVVVYASPSMMANRKPVDMRRTIFVYNVFMIGLSAYCLNEFLMSGWLAGYTLGCQLVDFSNSAQGLRMARACWIFYISKNIELIDTMFFILRKKTSHVTFLHVIHHGIMPLTWWVGVKFSAGGLGTFHAAINAFIHFVMYTYYALAALGPRVQRFLWWKKYLTRLQILQFVVTALHSSQLLFTDCKYNIVIQYIILSYALLFLSLFINFYIKAYRQSRRKKTEFTIDSDHKYHKQ